MRRAVQEEGKNLENTKVGPAVIDIGQLDAMRRALSIEVPKMDGVISSSTASGMDLRALAGDTRTMPAYEPLIPSKSGTEYAIERVEREVSRLASIAAEMAGNTADNARIAKTGLEQSIALVTVVSALHETTRQGIEANEGSTRSLVWLARVLAVLTIELVILTLVLVVQAR